MQHAAVSERERTATRNELSRSELFVAFSLMNISVAFGTRVYDDIIEQHFQAAPRSYFQQLPRLCAAVK